MSAPQRLREALDTLHWSRATLARILQKDKTQVQRWWLGEYEPPENVIVWLEMLAAVHHAHPEPKRILQKDDNSC